LKKVLDFIYFSAVAAIVLHLANAIYPENFALGNASYTVNEAALRAGVVWMLIYSLANPVAKAIRLELPGGNRTLYYFIVNFLSLWVTARFALIIGFGVSNFFWLFGLAFVANIFQHTTRKMLGE